MIQSAKRYAYFLIKTLNNPINRTFFIRNLKQWKTIYQNKHHSPPYTFDEALEKATNWLLLSQSKMKDNGIGSFKIAAGWSSSYPETTGYIIPSLLKYASLSNNTDITKKAISAAEWLVGIQKPSGGWQGECVEDNRPEVVFNTGQIIRGLLAAYFNTNNHKYLDSATKAGNWLVSIQEPNGSWIKNAFMGVARVYDSYVDVPLIELGLTIQNQEMIACAVKNLNWMIETKQNKLGWFSDCDNTIKHNHRPILHTISYTIDGILDAGILLKKQEYIDAAQQSANSLIDLFLNQGFLHGRYNSKWEGSEYIITTGYAQIGIVWGKLFKLTQEKKYLIGLQSVLAKLVQIQSLTEISGFEGNGALSGSFPVWGKYEPFSFPNWATKYFIDALLLEKELAS